MKLEKLLSDYKCGLICSDFYYFFEEDVISIIDGFNNYLSNEISNNFNIIDDKSINKLKYMNNVVYFMVDGLRLQYTINKNENYMIASDSLWNFYYKKVLGNKNIINKINDYRKNNKDLDKWFKLFFSYENKNKKITDKIIKISEKIKENKIKYCKDLKKCIIIPKNKVGLLKGIRKEDLKIGIKMSKLFNVEGLVFPAERDLSFNLLSNIENRLIRKLVYENYMKSYDDNLQLLKNLVKVKDDLAKVNQKESYYDLVSEKYMISSRDKVEYFLNKTLELIEPKNKVLINKLVELSNKDNISELKVWDYFYYETKLLKELKVDLSKKYEIKIKNVLDVLIDIFEKNLNIKIIKEENYEIGNRLLYRVVDNVSKREGNFILNIFDNNMEYSYQCQNLQPHFKNGKITSRNINLIEGNFGKNMDSKISLGNIIDLVHEMGHAFQSFYALYDDYEESSINNYSWDLIELSSQFLERYVYNEDILIKFLKNESIDNIEKKEDIKKWMNYDILSNIINIKNNVELNKKRFELFSNKNEDFFNKNGYDTIFNPLDDYYLLDTDYSSDYGPSNYIYMMNDIMADSIYNNVYKDGVMSLREIYVNLFNSKKIEDMHEKLQKNIDLSNICFNSYITKKKEIKI